MTKLVTALLLLLLAFATRAEDLRSFPGVENLMTAEEFSESGLDKLSAEERASLNDWLIQYTATQAPTIRESSQEVKEAERAHENVAAIKPPFTGWSGKTYFHLDNGQTWQQRAGGKYTYDGESTIVSINRNMLGFYTMELKATGKKVLVKKIK